MGLYRLTGQEPARAAALDRLLVLVEVAGVWEADDGVQVSLPGSLPPGPWPEGITWEALPEPAPCTGLEGDAPMWITEDLVVRPPWVASPAGFGGVELVVPRGSAFGSGEHGSTAAALRLLHRCWGQLVGGEAPSVADVGCGSGVLLAYCHARGARRLQACDIEVAAVRATEELVPGSAVRLGGPERLTMPVQWVIANMTGDELAGVWPEVMELWVGWARGSALLVSGLRPGEVMPCVERMGVLPADRETVGAFTALVWSADLEAGSGRPVR